MEDTIMLTIIEYYRSMDDGLWYFHLKAPNGGILVQSGGHTTEAECLDGIEMLKRFADVAVIAKKDDWTHATIYNL